MTFPLRLNINNFKAPTKTKKLNKQSGLSSSESCATYFIFVELLRDMFAEAPFCGTFIAKCMAVCP